MKACRNCGESIKGGSYCVDCAYLTIGQVQRLLKKTRVTLERWRSEGIITTVKLGACRQSSAVLIPRADIDRLLNQ